MDCPNIKNRFLGQYLTVGETADTQTAVVESGESGNITTFRKGRRATVTHRRSSVAGRAQRPQMCMSVKEYINCRGRRQILLIIYMSVRQENAPATVTQ